MPSKTETRQKTTSRGASSRKKAAGDDVHPASVLDGGGLSGELRVEVPGGIVRLTNLDKMLWPKEGYTKGDLIRYYHRISDYILPYLEGRPIILKRFPNGIAKGSFFQHEAGDVPAFVRTAALVSEEGREIDYILCDNEATLLYLANLGAIDRHPWHTQFDDPDHPDWFVFDLDPNPRVPFEKVCALAVTVREVLSGNGLESYPKTSGSKGMHVYVPIARRYLYEEVVRLADHVAQAVVERQPKIATLERSLDRRKGSRIYLDYLQNAKGKSVVAPYSVRPKPGATVSTPLSWEEVEQGVDPKAFTMETVPERLAQIGDLFRPVLENKQGLTSG